MISLTSSKDCLVSKSEDTYLTWDEMNITVVGPALQETLVEVEELCTESDSLYRIIFPLRKRMFMSS